MYISEPEQVNTTKKGIVVQTCCRSSFVISLQYFATFLSIIAGFGTEAPVLTPVDDDAVFVVEDETDCGTFNFEFNLT